MTSDVLIMVIDVTKRQTEREGKSFFRIQLHKHRRTGDDNSRIWQLLTAPFEGWKWGGCDESEYYRSEQVAANGKSRLARLSIRALSFRVVAPRRGSMLCCPYRYGPYRHIAIAIAFGIETWQTEFPTVWRYNPYREANRRWRCHILGVVWNLHLLSQCFNPELDD
jgi:hypothetical protein